jgi:hypothetical protein
MTSSRSLAYARSVEGLDTSALVLEKRLGAARAGPRNSAEPDSRLNISVVFTSIGLTLAALREAGKLASCLGAGILLLVPQVVPYPLPLESPPILLDWNESRFRDIADGTGVETLVRIYLCRDRLQAVRAVLSAGSIVVVGCQKSWWPTSEKRLARQLRQSGHAVIVTG